MIQGIDPHCLRLLIKAFNINRDMRHEMQLSQLITKVVPFTRTIFNDKIIEDDSHEEKGFKYLFTNLAYRSKKNIEKLKCMKSIYDM